MPDNDIVIREDPAVEEDPTTEEEDIFVANGVSFDGKHSYTEFGMWLSKRPDLGSPMPKTNIVDVPGMDGYLDLTEANAGEVKFKNRMLTFTFAAMVNVPDQETFKSVIRNALHGKVINQIILDEDSGWYYTGRANVEFQDIKPWKLKCVVTVDAAPYAMKVEETVVDLNNGSETQANKIRLDATDVSQQSWNTDLRLGTKEFPGGLFAPSNLYLAWPENPDRLNKYNIQVTESDGNVWTSSHSIYDPSANPSIVNLSGISAAGVDLLKVYRFLVSGIGGCYLYWEEYSYHYTVNNSRKAVIPIIELETQESDITITVNGKNYTILPGKAEYSDIVLKSGANEIYVPVLLQSEDVFTMTFREGKL